MSGDIMGHDDFEKLLRKMETDEPFVLWCKKREIDVMDERDFGGDEGYSLLDMYEAFVAGRLGATEW